jgi:uncharacterized glyoxalase superfamily protein PhnB
LLLSSIDDKYFGAPAPLICRNCTQKVYRVCLILSESGKVEMELTEQFWGDYFGSWSDKFGVQWMINTNAKQ